MSDISRQDTLATMTDILSVIQKVRNSIPEFCPGDWELHISDHDLRRLLEVCKYSTTDIENCFCGMVIIVDDRAIKPILMPIPKTDWLLGLGREES